MATVYLHIGAPKTATSTLQHILAKNYSRLLKAGVLYPLDVRHADAHHSLVCDLIEKHRDNPMADIWYGPVARGSAWESLRAEMSRHERSLHSVIISSELFFGQSDWLPDMLEDIADNLKGHDVKVVVYLRRQDQLYGSFYNQDVKGIRQWEGSAYEFYQTHQLFEHSYSAILNVWSEAFGKMNVIIRPFESEQWLGGNVVQDFCSAVGAPGLRSEKEEANESLGMIQLYIKRCLNKVGFDKQKNEEVVRILLEVGPEKPAKGCLYVHKRLYRKYREQWEHENTELSGDYLKNVPLFRQPIPEAKDLQPYELNPFAMAGYIDNVVKVFGGGSYREFRQLFARSTFLIIVEQDLWHALDAPAMAKLMDWANSP